MVIAHILFEWWNANVYVLSIVNELENRDARTVAILVPSVSLSLSLSLSQFFLFLFSIANLRG